MSSFIRGFAAVCVVLCMSCEEHPPARFSGVPEVTTTVAGLKAMYAGVPFLITGPTYIRCYVTANDRYGCFPRTLTVADGSGGLEIKVASEALWKDYWVGDCVTVDCEGLTLGSYGGTVSLGSAPEDMYENGFIPSGEFARRAVKSGCLSQPPTPLRADAGGLDPSMISRLVRFEGLTVAREDAGKAWAEGEVPTERRFTDFRGDTLPVSTYPLVSFASAEVPAGRCDLTGILGYFAGKYYLRLRGWDDIYEHRPSD